MREGPPTRCAALVDPSDVLSRPCSTRDADASRSLERPGMYSNSPRMNHAGLRLPPRSDSSPAVSPTSTTPHVFPSSTSAGPYDHHVPSAAPYPTQPQTNSSTARFHEALAARPFAKRHASRASASSIDSNKGFDPLDTTSPVGDRAFDAMQREFGAPSGHQGLGLSEATISNGYGGTSREMGRLHEEPEDYQDAGRIRAAYGARNYDDGMMRGQHARGAAGSSRELTAKPASQDLDNSMAFLLSPPTSYDNPTASAKQLAAAASEGSKPIPRSGRVFPAPLLLKGSTPSSPIFNNTTTPLSIPRRPSASAGGGGPGSHSSPLLGQYPGRSWGSSSVSRGEREREGPMGPPLSTSMSSSDNSRSSLPYQRHRSQQSSTSSISQGSYLPYNISDSYSMSGTRHQNNTSSSTASTSSPALGSSTGHPVPSHSSSSLSSMAPPLVPQPSVAQPAPSTSTSSSSDPPISSQALLLHIHSLRSASSPMTLSQSQGPLPRSPAPLLAQGQSHQRIRSAGSTAESDQSTSRPVAERSSSRPSSVPRLDTVDLSHKRIAEVPIEIVDELKDEVEKLALGYNLLKDLPPYFAGFGHRLKYLNVRVNLLTTFPAVVSCPSPSGFGVDPALTLNPMAR